MLLTPDAFWHDWYGWVTNQAGHVLLVGLPAFAAVAMTPLSRRAAFWLACVGYAVWEVLTFQGDVLDGLTDWAFVAAGAAFGWAAWEGDRRRMIWAVAGILAAAVAGAGVRL